VEAETCSDLAQEPTGQELVDVLEKILAEAHAANWPKPGPINTDCTWQVLQQATKVSRMAREICDGSTKAEWQPCAYSNYRQAMEQEIRHLYTCFGGLGEEEAAEEGGRQSIARSWYRRGETSIMLGGELSGPILSEPSRTSVPLLLCGGRTHSLDGEGGGGSIFWKTPDTSLYSTYVRTHSLDGEGGGGSIFWKTPDTALYSTYVSTL
jgi:hypothetical protein